MKTIERKVQLVELDILKKVVTLCEKHNIKYFAHAGTLLGAVRHGGFIPWDDDIDLMMPRPDFDKFCEIAEKELKYPYFLQTNKTDAAFNLYIAKVQNLKTTFIENAKSPKIHAGIFIDIFPIDGSKKFSFFERKWLEFKDRIYKYCALDLYVIKYDMRNKINKRIGNFINRYFFGQQSFQFFHNKRDQIYSVIPYDQAEIVVERHSLHFFDKKLLIDNTYLKFEDIRLSCPAEYDELLSLWYGNYMELPPEEQRHGHHGVIIDTEKSYTEYI